MTRLDPPHHRPNPRAWMDEARGRDGFSRHVVGSRGDREKESGYFSLGRAGGIRSFRDKSPPAPHRHSERGHPLPGNRSPEPKASIPFRNRDLGVPSQRRGSDLPNQDEPELCISPEPTPLERSIEVEAQVGPRSPSPTPFKQAESLVSSKRRGFNSSSYSRGNFSSSHQQSGLFNSSRQESGYSQSASPSRRPSLFNRGESLASLHSQSYTSVGFSQGREQRSKSPSSQSSFGRNFDNGGVQKSFKSIASTAGSKSLSSSYADLRGSLRKAESTSSLAGHGLNNRSSSPSRRVYEIPGQSMLRKTEANSSPSGCGGETNRLSRRGYDTPNQSSLHKTDVNLSSNGHYRSSCSPLRNGFDLPGPSILHKTDKNSSSFSRNASSDSRNSSPSGKGYDSPRLSMKHKEDTGRAFSGHGHDSRSSSPSRTGYGSLRPSLKHKEDANRSFSGHGRDSRNSSPSRTGYGSLRPSRRDKEEVERSFSGRSRGSRSSSPSGKGYDNSSQSVLRFTETSRPITTQINESPSPSNSRLSQQSKYETDSSRTVSGSNSRGSSPFKRSSDAPSHSVLRKTASHESRSVSPSAYTKKTLSTHSRSESNSSHGFSRGAQHPLRSPPGSRSSSPIRKSTENKPHAQVQRPTPVSIDNSRNSRRSSSTSRYGVEPRSKSPESRRSSGRARSQSPSTRRLTSSQSSLESTESSHLSGGSNGFNKDEYAMMADLPKVKTIYQREGPGHLAESRHTVREGLYKPASHTHTKDPHREYESGGDQYNGGRLSRAHSTSSLNMQRDSSPTVEETQPWKRQQRHPTSHQQGKKPSVCFSPNVESAEDTPAEQGWMSKQDENGEWKKHWFVLTDAGLRYYRDSGAEEKDDLDGEIDLKSCVKVSEFDVEKNYGFQIHTRDAVFTLSAMTAGIRRNWIEVLRKSVRPGSTPDLTLLPDTSSDKENSNSRTLPTPRRLHSHSDAGFSGSVHRKFDYVELSPVAAPSSPAPAAQREAGEGQVKEHSQWQEERTRDVASNQWEAVISRKGPGQSLDQKQRMEEEIEKKWAEFERLPLKEMKSLPLMGTRPGPLANEALQRWRL
ncbi:serine/arginine repetitive matrix protein 2 isoform X2 [Denticeps clupeoides]|uniref:serine/arginine repetitive matrix protein 2 isoform X2 n=1 Tax=Denticeps clupeoides TaxID=299321 RepID=UPI0010A5176A|nr:TRIO and F-actin-binding protein isoform X2 [Denticeps clupeoides]